MKLAKGLSLLAMGAVLVGCEITVGDGYSTGTGVPGAESDYVALAEKLADRIDFEEGYLDVKFVKLSKDQPGYAVFRTEEWMSDGGDVEYIAVDISGYNGSMFGGSNYLDSATVYHGLRVDPFSDNYYFDTYDEWGYPVYYTFEESETSSKDLEKIGAIAEEMRVAQSTELLSSEFGLSEDRAFKVAKLANNWNKVAKKRSMTPADANLFAKEVIGSDLAEVKEAMTEAAEGNEAGLSLLLEKAADLNGVSPEDMSEIMGEFMN